MPPKDKIMPYYLLRVPDVPEKGRDLNASTNSDEWLQSVVKDALTGQVHSFDATLSARMMRMKRSLEIVGGIYIKLDVGCDKCLNGFTYEQQIPFRILLEPALPGKAAGKEKNDEGEDVSEALDFSYYSGEEVDVGDLIRQHIAMAQPINHVCSEACKGLCAKCGKDLNEGPCQCKEDKPESPFAVLKQLKKR